MADFNCDLCGVAGTPEHKLRAVRDAAGNPAALVCVDESGCFLLFKFQDALTKRKAREERDALAAQVEEYRRADGLMVRETKRLFDEAHAALGTLPEETLIQAAARMAAKVAEAVQQRDDARDEVHGYYLRNVQLQAEAGRAKEQLAAELTRLTTPWFPPGFAVDVALELARRALGALARRLPQGALTK